MALTKKAIAKAVNQKTGVPFKPKTKGLKKTGDSFSIGESGVCQAGRRFAERIHKDGGLEMEVRKIENELVKSIGMACLLCFPRGLPYSRTALLRQFCAP